MTELLSVQVTALAAGHIREAEAWWRSNRLSAPNAIREELEKAFAMLSAQPNVGPRARHVRLAEVRRVYLARVKYDLYYRVLQEGRVVEVLAFWHSRRGESPPI